MYKQIKNKYANMLAVIISIAIVFDSFGFLSVPTASAADPLPAPQNVQVTGVTPKSVTLEWDPVVGVDQNSGYQVWYSNGGWATWVAVPTATISGLNPNTTYSFYVTAINAANDRSAIVTATTDAVPPAPQVSSVSVPGNGTYSSGQNLDFAVNFDQVVYVDTTNGTPYLSLEIGTKEVRATYLSGSGTNMLIFRYAVQAEDSDSDGIAVGALSLNGGTIKNSGSETNASLTLNSVGSTAGVLVDAPFEATKVSTNPVTNVAATSADVGGDVTSDGGAVVTERGIVYSTSSNPTIVDTKVVVAGTTGSYTANLTGLTAGTTYHARAFATNSVGTSYGNDISFTTTTPSSVATVITVDPVTNVTATSADVGGDVTSDGGAVVTERGIVYSTSSNPTIVDTKVVDAGTTGSYTANLTGLTAGTTYHARAFATNSVGTSYGNDISIITLSSNPPIVTVIGMSLNEHTGAMQVGDTFAVVATATMSDSTTQDVTSLITWTADDPSKVTIHNGVITALQSGTVKVKATYSGTSVFSDYVNLTLYAKGTVISSPMPLPPVQPAPEPEEPKTEVPEPVQPVNSFTDTQSHWARDIIEEIAAAGIITGYEDGTFRPNESVSRQHIAVMLQRALDLQAVRQVRAFNDVAANHTYYEAIMALANAGIIDGYNGNYNPNVPMTRAQLAKVLVLAFDLTPGGASTFADVSENHWSYPYIAALADAGIALGDEGNFRPNEPVTRAQFVAFLYRLMQTK